MKEKKQLTKAETQVMSALWSLPGARGHSTDIMKQLPEPKPAPTTLLTFLKILTEKGFISSVKRGKMLFFTANISREEYIRSYMAEVKCTFFGGSFASLVSFFAKNEHFTDEEVEELVDIIKNQREG